jgi:hypothetical protein
MARETDGGEPRSVGEAFKCRSIFPDVALSAVEKSELVREDL